MADIEERMSMIRAMANTLRDNGINPFDKDRVCVTLLQAGFTASSIEPIYDDVIAMASMRWMHDQKAKHAKGY
jgi:hypothetical protein